MKKFILLILILCTLSKGFANHISGGELYYEYKGMGPNGGKVYQVTMRLFRDCLSNGQTLATERVVVGVYNSTTSALVTSSNLILQTPVRTITLNTNSIPCLTNAPYVCFEIGIFTASIELPSSEGGYTLTWIRCCRADAIANLPIATGLGATFVAKIPGSVALPSGDNSSPQFAIKDTALVCQNKNFTLDFGATDPDKDSLSYSFCSAYQGGTPTQPNPSNEPGGPATVLSLVELPYAAPFYGYSPLGASVTINPATGIIRGKAPAAGRYVINVCVSEWRNGKVFNEHRKDFILEITDCDFVTADPLPLAGAWCKDFKVNFSNDNTSANVLSYEWNFGIPGATSTLPAPQYTYADTGIYKVKLKVTGARGCIDEDSTTVGVYPGFKPDFTFTGSCFKSPFQFTDKTVSPYGTISSHKWDFGDVTNPNDVSTARNPSYKYPDPGERSVKLVVANNRGCIDSTTRMVQVKDVAALNLAFRDTLICSTDTLKLSATSTGTVKWSPDYNLINSTSFSPSVFPRDTTVYYVSVVDGNGCSNMDSVVVNVLDKLSVNAGADTTICLTDTIMLQATSQGLQYQWTPLAGLSNASSANTLAVPAGNTTYHVVARLGKCIAQDDVLVRTINYPAVDAGPDVSLCYGATARINAAVTASSFTWSPINGLSNPRILNPFVSPGATTMYVLTASDTLGCPKQVTDTVNVAVIPPVRAFAGNDTVVVANQPLQLNAAGGTQYLWSPNTGMDNFTIANPIVTLPASIDSVLYTVRVSTAEGCSATDNLKVRVFKTAPDIFVPSAFTPNNDGRNDYARPIPVGMRSLTYFKVFNRWGQQLFSSSGIGSFGWAGYYKGVQQAAGTYIYVTEGVDYLGNRLLKKGTIVLIR